MAVITREASRSAHLGVLRSAHLGVLTNDGPRVLTA